MDVRKINNIKEVKITPKKTITFYALISNDTKIDDPEYKYFIWHQSINLDDVINYEKKMENGKEEGREFKIYSFELPA